MGMDLLYEDDSLLVLNKPSGLIVHAGDGTRSEETLFDQLVRYCPDIGMIGDDRRRGGIVHRLDKNTEGLMVVTKTQVAFEHLKAQFQAHHIEKRYVAMVYGNPKDDEWEITYPIGRHPKKRHLFAVSPTGKPARTVVKVVKRFGTTTLLDLRIYTGRTHQIRVHLAHQRLPVVGDPCYGPNAHASGQKLQAYCLGFWHPTQDKVFMRFLLPYTF